MSRVLNDAKQQLLHPTQINQSIRCRLRFVLGPRGWMSRNHPHAHFLFYGGYLVIEQMVDYESGLAIVLLTCLRIRMSFHRPLQFPYKSRLKLLKSPKESKYYAKLRVSDMDVSKNSGTFKSSHFNRVFHYFHHPFWGKHPYFWKHPHREPNSYLF